MTNRPRPHVIAFDVMETLFPLDPLDRRFQDAGLPPGLMRLWFERTLRNAFALTVTGEYKAFREIALGALADVSQHRLSVSVMEKLIGAIATLNPRPDAALAMHRAKDMGLRVIALTNGAAMPTQQMLEHAELSSLVEMVISVEDAGSWKPTPDPYRYAAEMHGVAPAHMALVSAHAWDIHGAHRAGLTTGWSSHLEGRFPHCFDHPDVTGPGLDAVVERLLLLSRRPPPVL